VDSKREIVPRSPRSHDHQKLCIISLICSHASRPSLKISLRVRSSDSLFQKSTESRAGFKLREALGQWFPTGVPFTVPRSATG